MVLGPIDVVLRREIRSCFKYDFIPDSLVIAAADDSRRACQVEMAGEVQVPYTNVSIAGSCLF